MAAILDVSQQTISKYVAEGMPKADRGKYDIAACVQWRISQLDRLGTDEESTNVVRSREELYRAQTRGQQLKNMILDGQTVPLDLVKGVLNEIAGILAAQHDAIAPRCSEDPAVQQAILEEQRAVRESLAGAIEGLGQRIADSRFDSEAAAETQHGRVRGRQPYFAARKS